MNPQNALTRRSEIERATADSDQWTWELQQPLQFPQCALEWKNYNGFRLIAATLFVMALYYVIGSFLRPQGWFSYLIDHIPVVSTMSAALSIMFRSFVLLCAYSLLWLSFDPRGCLRFVSGSFALLLGAIYVISPIDLIPDAIPVLGNLDDLAVGGAAALIGMRGFRSLSEESATKALVQQALIDDRPAEALRLLLNDAGIKFKEVRGSRH